MADRSARLRSQPPAPACGPRRPRAPTGAAGTGLAAEAAGGGPSASPVSATSVRPVDSRLTAAACRRRDRTGGRGSWGWPVDVPRQRVVREACRQPPHRSRLQLDLLPRTAGQEDAAAGQQATGLQLKRATGLQLNADVEARNAGSGEGEPVPQPLDALLDPAGGAEVDTANSAANGAGLADVEAETEVNTADNAANGARTRRRRSRDRGRRRWNRLPISTSRPPRATAPPLGVGREHIDDDTKTRSHSRKALLPSG